MVNILVVIIILILFFVVFLEFRRVNKKVGVILRKVNILDERFEVKEKGFHSSINMIESVLTKQQQKVEELEKQMKMLFDEMNAGSQQDVSNLEREVKKLKEENEELRISKESFEKEYYKAQQEIIDLHEKYKESRDVLIAIEKHIKKLN